VPRVFVYGTLKRGFPLHGEGLADAKFLGAYRPVAPYPMVIGGPRFAPMMLHQPGRGVRVSGELYQVSPDQIAKLDAPRKCRLAAQYASSSYLSNLSKAVFGPRRTRSSKGGAGAVGPSGWLAIYLLDPRFNPPK
jgi:gamma-glutamylcyclotransferase (GGCT)/AIG2-like uncharacterized protein YtfP